MILTKAKKRVVVNAGHWNEDGGSSANGIQERDAVKRIRDEVIPLLQRAGFEVFSVPDDLDLKTSIAWCNKVLPNLEDGLAIDIHLNYNGSPKPEGTCAFYGQTETSRLVAAALSTGIAHALGTKDLGAKPDTEANVGSLGWIRLTKCWATLVEVLFMSNPDDAARLKAERGYHRAALGIAWGICDTFGVPRVEESESIVRESVRIIEAELVKIKRVIGDI